MKANPFYKYLTKEDKLQHRIISYLKYQYPIYYLHMFLMRVNVVSLKDLNLNI